MLRVGMWVLIPRVWLVVVVEIVEEARRCHLVSWFRDLLRVLACRFDCAIAKLSGLLVLGFLGRHLGCL